MKCPHCQHENHPQAKFCEECAAPLARTCANCGTQLSATAKFCHECAHPVTPRQVTQSRFASLETYTPKHLAEKILTSKSALEGERKQVTVLFADMKGSMELLADRDPEEARKLLDPVIEHMMEAVHRYEGTVSNLMGDGIMALFGAPLAHEDHAVRACSAYFKRGDYDRAISHFRGNVDSLVGDQIYERFGLVFLASVGSRYQLVLLHSDRGEFTEAAIHGNEVIRIAEMVNHPYNLYTAYFAVGSLHLRKGAIDKAISALERSLELCRSWNIRQNIPRVAVALGNAYAAAGRVGDALPILDLANRAAARLDA